MDLCLITKDNEVSDIGLVQARVGKRESDPIITLAHINTQLAVLHSQFQNIQVELEKMDTLRVEMEKIVGGVILKKGED